MISEPDTGMIMFWSQQDLSDALIVTATKRSLSFGAGIIAAEGAQTDPDDGELVGIAKSVLATLTSFCETTSIPALSDIEQVNASPPLSVLHRW